ncbi:MULTISPECIES: EscU/YscU/HrcU family type III secretion system export apparatus switch protein [unclassified Pseudomonas]|uniref:EscU/YscU/HrcU family type III secretion system export apparatus switch protein n=1 Tax=Pseudomonas TaxID=286 RepID=UPI00258086B2|nr:MULTISPECIES: EscU/YscU/HrcU family type III secretion system export apparatus switch protein [unclassified Pseudomonas]
MSQQTEEKSLPASAKKLRDARKKGQLPKSQDLVTGMVILACTLCVVVIAADIEARVEALLLEAGRIYVEPFTQVWPRLQMLGLDVLMAATLPLFAVTVVTVILTNIVVMRGMVFSAEPVKPTYERIDPVAGFKRIFSMRSVIEFLKALIKLCAMAVAFIIVYRLGLQRLMESSYCGTSCLYATFLGLLKPLVITAIIAFLIVGGFDVLMQRWLFAREMRMTKSEQKRELKDTDGNPMVKRERQRLRRDMQSLSAKRGLQHASLIIGAPGQWVVGLRYVRGETPVPVIVCRAEPEQSHQMIQDAQRQRLPYAVNGGLAERIAQRTAGEGVPEATFQAVADILVGARLI